MSNKAAFNPATQYGNFAYVTAKWSEEAINKAKASLRENMETFIPPGHRRRVEWICNPPRSEAVWGTVAWKYNPPREGRQ